MLGKIYEEKGWKGKATEYYEKFLALWKDADPGFLQICDRGISQLKKSLFNLSLKSHMIIKLEGVILGERAQKYIQRVKTTAEEV